MAGWSIRPEKEKDQPFITSLTKAAFRGLEYSDGKEATIVEGLRADGDLALSLVAENEDKAIIGHLALSPVTISNETPGWYGLGPVSIIPLRQRVGIGKALIETALDDLRTKGAGGCVVLGDPAYYARFGFRRDPALVFPGPPPEYFQRLVLNGPAPQGTVTFSPAFDV